MSIAIKIENLSKAYQIGQIGTGTISRDLERWWVTRVRGKEDPFLKIGETNDRTTKSESGVVWSLKDINLEVAQGDAVGIIGRNGAGKSTLLKTLSRVTAPTTGSVKIRGRVASLLEVGTGFHPELTGRENIYLNGSILGMRKKEIDRKLDEIVDFSGVERYIDTPVKRYSSGMSVRLAFAVAAHLDSEILVVDEVLAVGDAEFQKKCLGKMDEVSRRQGRTILFVSHNLFAIRELCNYGVLIKDGSISISSDSIDETILGYSRDLSTDNAIDQIEKSGFRLTFDSGIRRVQLGGDLHLGFRIKSLNGHGENVQFNLELKSDFNEPVYCIGNEFNNFPLYLESDNEVHISVKINEIDLKPGDYKFLLWCRAGDTKTIFSDFVPQWRFTVEKSDYLNSGGKLPSRQQHGAIIKKYREKFFDKKSGEYRLEV